MRDVLIFFVREAKLKEIGRIPRRGSDSSFKHPVTGLTNENVCEAVEDFDSGHTCFVFVSHRLLRPEMGAAAPDDAYNSKLKLILKVFEKLRGANAPVPEHFDFAV
jgi:hypothetical protein